MGGQNELQVAPGADPGQPIVPRSRQQRRGIWRHGTVLWYATEASVRARGFASRAILALSSFGLILWPLLRVSWKWGLGYSIAWLTVAFWKGCREINPKIMQLVQEHYLARKLRLNKLLHDIYRARLMTPEEVERYRVEALALIALFVRDHRFDTKGTKVFVNLLAEDGDDMVVVARDEPDRRHEGARVPKVHTLVWEAIFTGEPACSGDIRADFPETPADKPYKSVLAIPVKARRVGRPPEVVGVVSIDSSRKYHFERDQENLVQYLLPYVTLLAWTLDPEFGRTNLRAPLNVQQGGAA